MNNYDRLTKFYKSRFLPLLRKLTSKDPESAHDLTLLFLRLFTTMPLLPAIVEKHIRVSDLRLQRTLFRGTRAVTIANPIGVAAGLDKNALAPKAWQMLGFGFAELGGIVSGKQDGNPRPRIVHHEDGIQNSMGFPSHGAPTVGKRIAHSHISIPLGVNIGKMKDVPIESAAQDYCKCLRRLAEAGVDFGLIAFITLNPSSPNTANLRRLEAKRPLYELVCAGAETAFEIARKQGHPDRPAIVAKMSPDLTFEQVDAFGEACIEAHIDGFIATNTTVNHPYPEFPFGMKGGHSGPGLYDRSFRIVKYLREHAPAHMTIIGVGGVDRPERTKAMLEEAGADAIQMLTGLIREGPMLPRECCMKLLERK